MKNPSLSASAHRVGAAASVNFGEFYGGTRWGLNAGAQIRFNERLSVDPGYGYNHVDLPTGIFNTHTVTTRITYNFNETWLTNSLVQYNSVSGRMSVYAR